VGDAGVADADDRCGLGPVDIDPRGSDVLKWSGRSFDGLLPIVNTQYEYFFGKFGVIQGRHLALYLDGNTDLKHSEYSEKESRRLKEGERER
jgi:hypothetical protein